jgi:hypothetical protein
MGWIKEGFNKNRNRVGNKRDGIFRLSGNIE